MSGDCEDGELGICDLCGQAMIRTDDDCWHPWNVPVGCPPAPDDLEDQLRWLDAGNRYGRPGREHFRRVEP